MYPFGLSLLPYMEVVSSGGSVHVFPVFCSTLNPFIICFNIFILYKKNPNSTETQDINTQHAHILLAILCFRTWRWSVLAYPCMLFYLCFDLCCSPVSHPQQRPSGHYSSAGYHGAMFPAWTGFATERERWSCSCGSEFQLELLALFLPQTGLKHTLWNCSLILVHFHVGQ